MLYARCAEQRNLYPIFSRTGASLYKIMGVLTHLLRTFSHISSQVLKFPSFSPPQQLVEIFLVTQQQFKRCVGGILPNSTKNIYITNNTITTSLISVKNLSLSHLQQNGIRATALKEIVNRCLDRTHIPNVFLECLQVCQNCGWVNLI